MSLRVLCVLTFDYAAQLDAVARGHAPAESLYALDRLAAHGFEIAIAPLRHANSISRLAAPVLQKLRRRGFNPVDLSQIAQLRRYDLVLVKDSVSLSMAAAARLAGVPCIFVDGLFTVSRWSFMRGLTQASVRASSGVVGYSSTQNDYWARESGVPRERLPNIPFGLDIDFYPPLDAAISVEAPYVLTVGRDPRRDFQTLLDAMRGSGLALKIISLPYLTERLVTHDVDVQFLERVSYPELFQLYQGASVVAIPLAPDINYPSGIRGMLEAMAVQRPVVATRTSCLEEYANHDVHVRFVQAGDPQALRMELVELSQDSQLRDRLTRASRARLGEHYTLLDMADGLAAAIRGLIAMNERSR